MKKLIRIKEYLDKKAGYDISVRSRNSENVNYRTLYFKLATETTTKSSTAIGKIVDRDHATVLHARGKLFNELMTFSKFREIYFEYKKDILGHEYTREYKNEIQFNDLQNKYNNSLVTINDYILKEGNSTFLTPIEKQFRNLNKKDKITYNERASLVLKSFEWKNRKRNEEFEVINCSL
jgi:hypothetical protein